MSVGAIIFSRYSSERLPGKALIDIAGRCLLGRVIDRSKSIKGIEKIIVATSNEGSDDLIDNFAKEENIDVYRGSLNNVAERALAACDKFKLTKFARICGDRPFFDPGIVSKLIKIHGEMNLDIATNTYPSCYPPGMSAEVLSVKTLKSVIALITDNQDREHLTSYFYRYAHNFKIKNIAPIEPLNCDDINLCVDNEKDLERAIWIANQLNNKGIIYDNIPSIISLARCWEEFSS